MDIMDLLAQARPGSLDPRLETDRRASDLARAIATPRAGMTAQPGASRRLGVRRASPPARVIAIGISAAALAGTAGAVVALSATGTPAPRPQPTAVHAGTAVATPGELKNAILTAFNGVGGDVFYNKITETYPGKMSKWNGVSQSWAYPLQPQAGQKAYSRNLVVPSSPGEEGDAELIWTEPSGAKAMLPTKTEVIDVEYGSRTWSVTTAPVAVQSEAGPLQALRESIVNGTLAVVGKTEVDGQTVLELTTRSKDASKGSVQTWWVNPVTYLPVRTLSIESGVTIQVDYGFLPPTPANIAELKVTIPAGFTRTPTIQK
jgi:outer membrane lipoprotein-sorting protein